MANLCVKTELCFAECLLFYFISSYSSPLIIKCSLLMLEDKELCVYKSAQWSWEERMCSPIVFMQVPFSSLVKTKIHCGQKKKAFCIFLRGFFSMFTMNYFLANRIFNRMVYNYFEWSPYSTVSENIMLEIWVGLLFLKQYCTCKTRAGCSEWFGLRLHNIICVLLGKRGSCPYQNLVSSALKI